MQRFVATSPATNAPPRRQPHHPRHAARCDLLAPRRCAVLALGLAGVALFACVKRLDPQAPPELPITAEKAAPEFEHARALFERGQLDAADRAFAELARNAQRSALIAQAARLYRGRIALETGHPGRAYDLLTPLSTRSGPEALAGPSSYFLGLACARSDRYVQALALLTPQLERLSDDARPAALAAMALSNAQLGRPAQAIRHLAALGQITDRPVERAYAAREVRRLLGELREGELGALQSELASGSLAAALVAESRMLRAKHRGDAKRLRELQQTYADLLRRHGLELLETSEEPPVRAEPALGVLLPERGPFRAAAELALQGIVAAAGIYDARPSARVLPLHLRDSSEQPARAAESLVRESHVAAVVGVFDPSEIRSVAETLERFGVPFLALAPNASGRAAGHPVFQLMPDNSARAAALAQAALTESREGPAAQRAALLIPRTPFGEQMREAFVSAWTAAGATVAATLRYAPSERSFTEWAEQLARLEFEVLFVPESADRLGLIAAALARAGLWSVKQVQKGRSSPTQGRPIRVLATADGISVNLLRSARRYLQGALFAPGFAPTEDEATRRLLEMFGREPTWQPGLIAAVAFDGALLVKASLAAIGATPAATQDDGSQGRAPLSRELTRATVHGLTGVPHFDARGLRADAPVLYTIDGDRIVRINRAERAPAVR